jgi:hypothetical protein
MAIAVAAVAIVSLTTAQPTPADSDFKSDWAVERGFDIISDADGFRFPTAIAFIPNPGNRPKDPLYFVTELHGAIKVVTNDRTVFTFADEFFTLRPKTGEVRIIDQEVGMAGICLAPEQGHLFVTFAYHDSDNILRNNVTRFQSTPGTYSMAPTSQINFTEVFAPYPSGPSHQVGGCQVSEDLLYVSVADAHQPDQSQQTDSMLGKIVRMTLDGRPVPDNPYYQDDEIGKAQNYVWASGFRNPFGLKIVDGQVFVSDNGPTVDRFLQVKQGGNYLYDGTNMSIGTNADTVFSPGRGVAQLDNYPPGSDLFPDRFNDNIFLTMTGNPQVHREGFPAIWAIPYDFSEDKLSAVARPLIRHRGNQNQVVSGLGFGPDGLYFALLVPNDSGSSQVLKIRYAPEADYPLTLADELNPIVLINTHGCLACHSLLNSREGEIGPNLDPSALVPKLEARLNSKAYALNLEELELLDSEPFASYRDVRHAITQAQGLEKISLWIYNRILEPKFDDQDATMPSQGLSDAQAKAVADYLSGISAEASGADKSRSAIGTAKSAVYDKVFRPIENQFPYPTRENAKVFLGVMFVVGVLTGALLLALSIRLLAHRRRRRSRGASN